MKKFVFEEDAIIAFPDAKNADPQVIGESLEKIRRERGGELRPHDVVEAARDPSHALHRHFEWNDSKAASAYRLDQARSLVRIVRVIDDTVERGHTRAFVSVTADHRTTYRSMDDVKASVDLRDAVLKSLDGELAAIQRRYREFRDICEQIEPIRQEVGRRRASRVTNRESRPGA